MGEYSIVCKWHQHKWPSSAQQASAVKSLAAVQCIHTPCYEGQQFTTNP